MERKRDPGSAVTAETGFGTAHWLGILFAVLLWGNAVWSVAAKFIGLYIGSRGNAELTEFFASANALFSAVLFGGGMLVLFLLAAKLTNSFPNRAAFLFAAAGEAVRLLCFGASFLIRNAEPSLALDACSVTFRQGMYIAMLLLFASNRENSAACRSMATAAAAFSLLTVAGQAVYYLSMWNMLRSAVPALSLAGRIAYALQWFLCLIWDVLTGSCFLLMREPVPVMEYPKEETDEDDPFSPDAPPEKETDPSVL